MDCKRIATISILASLCVGIQLAPRPPNVELTSLICFLTGFLFGAFSGALLGALTMFINGFLSPYGFAGTIIMPFQIIGMALIGFAGGVYRKLLGRNFAVERQLKLEVCFLASFLTLIYDVITNVSFAVQFNLNLIVALFAGAWPAVIHNISNVTLFGGVFFPLTEIIGNLVGEKICIKELW